MRTRSRSTRPPAPSARDHRPLQLPASTWHRAGLASEDSPAARPDGVAELTVDSEPPQAQRAGAFSTSDRHPQWPSPSRTRRPSRTRSDPARSPDRRHTLPQNRTNRLLVCRRSEQGRPPHPRRIFERGVGRALSSGTGATGAAIAICSRAGTDRTTPLRAPPRASSSCWTAASSRSRSTGICTLPVRLGASGVRWQPQRGVVKASGHRMTTTTTRTRGAG